MIPEDPKTLSNKQPRIVLAGEAACAIYAFPPNRHTLGATAYLIVENQVRILVDCPAWDEGTQTFLEQQGPIDWLFITHRGGIGQIQALQQALGCKVLIQEQEAYLLPGITPESFQQDYSLSLASQVIWTPGHSPGSSCLYLMEYGGVLFTGRHLLPDPQGQPTPLRTAKTFHWPRQIRSVRYLLEQFTPETLNFICPGANTGFLRGQRAIDQAYDRLAQLDLVTCLRTQPLL
ncbi:MBL fold metallo-hydrolase [Leptolyngbya sp. 'hensonii']|nr:MBL fold metallo-hydrolase [Leptolyngbya sp. 'hensonii']